MRFKSSKEMLNEAKKENMRLVPLMLRIWK